MADFYGTNVNEDITPSFVSPTVGTWPPGSKPSDDVDIAYGGGGNDTPRIC